MNELLTQLATQLGTTVEYLWPILVAKQKILGAFNILGSIFFFGVFAAGLYGTRALWRASNRDSCNEPEYRLGAGFLGATSVVLGLGLSIAFAYDATVALLLPEAAALTELMKLVN